MNIVLERENKNQTTTLRWTCGVTMSDRIMCKRSNERRSRENKRWFGRVEKINNDETIEKMREIKAEGTREKDKAKNTWIRVIREAYGSMVCDNEVRRRRTHE